MDRDLVLGIGAGLVDLWLLKESAKLLLKHKAKDVIKGLRKRGILGG